MKKWAKEEIDILKNNYEANSSEFLCQALPNRTWNAIQLKASKLKLTWLTAEERFWKYVNKGQSHECWNWTGSCNNYGYGQIEINKKLILAHRFSRVLHTGAIPMKTPCVLHHCDNPKCVNPNHLFLGTKKDNMDDKVSKNRQTKGENVHTTKLILDQVKEIRQFCCEGKLTQREIAKNFDVSQPVISSIHRNKTWRHIK